MLVQKNSPNQALNYRDEVVLFNTTWSLKPFGFWAIKVSIKLVNIMELCYLWSSLIVLRVVILMLHYLPCWILQVYKFDALHFHCQKPEKPILALIYPKQAGSLEEIYRSWPILKLMACLLDSTEKTKVELSQILLLNLVFRNCGVAINSYCCYLSRYSPTTLHIRVREQWSLVVIPLVSILLSLLEFLLDFHCTAFLVLMDIVVVNDSALVDGIRTGANARLKVWSHTLDFRGFRLRKSKTEYSENLVMKEPRV